MAGFSSKIVVLVSLLGLLALLLCGTSEGEWAWAFSPRKQFSVLLCSVPAMPRCACSQLAAGWGWDGREFFQQSMLPKSSSVDGEWIVRELNSKYPRQHGLNRFYLLCRFPSFQHKATRIAACLTPKFACLVGPWRVILNNSPVKSVISMQSCKLLFKRSCFFLTCINFRMSGQKQLFEHYKHGFSCFFKMLN